MIFVENSIINPPNDRYRCGAFSPTKEEITSVSNSLELREANYEEFCKYKQEELKKAHEEVNNYFRRNIVGMPATRSNIYDLLSRKPRALCPRFIDILVLK